MTGLLHSTARNPAHFYSERKNLDSWTAGHNHRHSVGADEEITEGLKQWLSPKSTGCFSRVLVARGIRVLFPALK